MKIQREVKTRAAETLVLMMMTLTTSRFEMKMSMSVEEIVAVVVGVMGGHESETYL